MPKHAHLEWYEPESKRRFSIGITDDRKRLYLGFQTRTGAGDVMMLKKKDAAELAGSVLSWVQHHLLDDDEPNEIVPLRSRIVE